MTIITYPKTGPKAMTQSCGPHTGGDGRRLVQRSSFRTKGGQPTEKRNSCQELVGERCGITMTMVSVRQPYREEKRIRIKSIMTSNRTSISLDATIWTMKINWINTKKTGCGPRTSKSSELSDFRHHT